MRNIVKLGSVGSAALLGAGLLCSGPAAADQVIADDLIVQGSICAGFDCVVNEAFGFDTLRLKENNTRIGFDDTSVGAFPANDWQIVANSADNGGASFLAFADMTNGTQPFTVSARAPTNALFLSSTGNLGLGTSTPLLDLHITTGDTPAIRLEQTAASGFTAQTWDVGGNEANFFIRDLTGGSRLPFRIRPGAPTSSIDISAAGNVGIGTASPPFPLSINSTTNPSMTILVNNTQRASMAVTTAAGQFSDISVANDTVFRVAQGGNLILESRDNASTHGNIFFTTGNPDSAKLTILNSGSVGIGITNPQRQLNTTGTVRFAGIPNCAAGIGTNASGDLACLVSSARFKDIRGPLTAEAAVANIMAMRPEVGSYKETPEVPEHWLIAEDVAAIDPALAGFRDGAPYTVKTQNVVADLVAVIQEQQKRIDALEQKIASR